MPDSRTATPRNKEKNKGEVTGNKKQRTAQRTAEKASFTLDTRTAGFSFCSQFIYSCVCPEELAYFVDYFPIICYTNLIFGYFWLEVW